MDEGMRRSGLRGGIALVLALAAFAWLVSFLPHPLSYGAVPVWGAAAAASVVLAAEFARFYNSTIRGGVQFAVFMIVVVGQLVDLGTVVGVATLVATAVLVSVVVWAGVSGRA